MSWSSMITQTGGNGLILAFVAGIPLWACHKRVKVFDHFIEGAQDGFHLAVRIIPYLVAFMVAMGMFRAAGGFVLLGQLLGPALHLLGMPAELLPLAIVRPFSGGASQAMLADLAQHHGGNSLISQMGATLLGSTETTFYVVMVYFGAVKITQTRHAIACGLIADVTSVFAACWMCGWLLG